MKTTLCILGLSLVLAGCNSRREGVILTTAANVAYAQPVQPPIEGVYPDCKFGLYAPELGMGRVCPPPAIN